MSLKTICYYISDYGFGHATRSIAVIRELLAKSNQVRIIICHSFAMDFMKESLADEENIVYRKISTDIGYTLKSSSLEPDIQGMNSDYDNYLSRLDAIVSEEIPFCKSNDVNAILSDIVAFPFKVAKELNIPSIGISNFTWYTAYKQLIEEDKLEPIKKYYSLMTYNFSLAASNEPGWASKEEWKFNFVSRECDESIIIELRKMIDTTGSKLIVYFGLGMKVYMD